MDFQAAEAWYVSHFGEAPTIIPIFKESENEPKKVIASLNWVPPIRGTVTTPFSVDLIGIEITPNQDSKVAQQVKSLTKGRIIEVLTDSQSGKTLTIQHTGGLIATYGHVDTNLKVNDWVEAGDILGWLSIESNVKQPSLYLAMKQGNVYIDPLEVISID
ncbi:Stage IV sporulation protein FA [compost metagenome]